MYTFIASEKYLFLTSDYAVVVEMVGLGDEEREVRAGSGRIIV